MMTIDMSKPRTPLMGVADVTLVYRGGSLVKCFMDAHIASQWIHSCILRKLGVDVVRSSEEAVRYEYEENRYKVSTHVIYARHEDPRDELPF